MTVRARVARQLVRLYPRAWRARYEDEFVAMLESRDELTSRDAADIVLAAVREWARLAARWPTREPANDLKGLTRQAQLDLVVLLVSGAAIDAAARIAAHGFETHNLIGGTGALTLVQTAAVLRLGATQLHPRKEVFAGIGSVELAVWYVAIFAATIAAHLSQTPALFPDVWWTRVTTTPLFPVYLSLTFVTFRTIAAQRRITRRTELLEARRRASVSSHPLGLM